MPNTSAADTSTSYAIKDTSTSHVSEKSPAKQLEPSLQLIECGGVRTATRTLRLRSNPLEMQPITVAQAQRTDLVSSHETRSRPLSRECVGSSSRHWELKVG